MRRTTLFLLALATLGALLAPAPVVEAGGSEPAEAPAPTGAPAISLEADRILRAMGEYLQTAEEFAFEAHIAYDGSLPGGQMIQYGGTAKVAVHRPDRVHGREYRRF